MAVLNSVETALPGGDSTASDIGFILEAWRQAATGNAASPNLLQAFGKRCGGEPGELIEAYFMFLRCLGKSSRRRLAVGHPGCPGMTRDEVQVFGLLAGAQTGQWQLFDAHLCWLVPQEGRPIVAAAAMTLAAALSAQGIEICDVLPQAPQQNARPCGLTLVRAAAH